MSLPSEVRTSVPKRVSPETRPEILPARRPTILVVALAKGDSKKSIRLSLMLFAAALVTMGTACSASDGQLTGPMSTTVTPSRTATSSGTFILSSVTPPVSCEDASGAVTTVNGATATLGKTGTFGIVINAQKTSTTGAVTPETYTSNGTFTQSGSTLVFKVPGVGSFAGTLSGGTLTVSNYPYCGATHTLVFTQQA